MEYKTHIKLVHELYGTCFQYNVKSKESTILTRLFVVTMPYGCLLLWWADCVEDFE